MPDYRVVCHEVHNPDKLPDVGLTEFNEKVRELIQDGYTCIGAPFKEYVIRKESVRETNYKGGAVMVEKNTKVCVIWYQAMLNPTADYQASEPNSGAGGGGGGGGGERRRKTLRKRK